MFFDNRVDAGKKLAKVFLDSGKDFSGFQVIGIARGGVIVGAEVAKELGLSLKAICIKSLETKTELIAVTSLGTAVIFCRKGEKAPRFVKDISTLKIRKLSKVIEELKGREVFYNNDIAFESGNKIILCDDGLVSGHSSFSAIYAFREKGAEEVILGIPVVPKWFTQQNWDFEYVTWRKSSGNFRTGLFYKEFEDTPDEEVVQAIRERKSAAVVLSVS